MSSKSKQNMRMSRISREIADITGSCPLSTKPYRYRIVLRCKDTIFRRKFAVQMKIFRRSSFEIAIRPAFVVQDKYLVCYVIGLLVQLNEGAR